MPIEFNCPHCATAIRVPETAAGKQAKCPACGGVCTVPASAPPLAQSLGASAASGVNPYAASPDRHLQSVASAVGRMPLASRGSRLAARFIDVFLILIPMLIAGIGWALVSESVQNDALKIGGMIVGSLCVFGTLAVVIVNMMWMTNKGETLGKWAMSIRVVNDADGKPPGFVKGVLLRSWLMAVLNQVPFLGLVDTLMIFTEKRQCLHDLIASTRVVEGRFSSQPQQL